MTDADELRLLAPEAFACRTLALVPCHALIRNDFAITRLWSRLDQGRSTGTVAPGPETVLVWRSDVSVHHRRLGPREAQLLRLVAGGTTVERLCDQAATGTEVTAAAHEVFRFVQRWTADGLLSAVDHTDRRSHGGDP